MTGGLRDFIERADAASWRGLPDLRPGDLGAAEPWLVSRAAIGDPPYPVTRVALPPGCFAAGLTGWLAPDGRILVLEGVRPRDAGGAAIPAPELGEPGLRLPTMLGSLTLERGELVYADRGLAARVNPDNGVLLGLIGFAPTTADDYVRRLRPVVPAAHPLPEGSLR